MGDSFDLSVLFGLRQIVEIHPLPVAEHPDSCCGRNFPRHTLLVAFGVPGRAGSRDAI